MQKGDEDIDVLIGKNLRRLREARRLSQGDLAKKINVNSSRISAIENGREGMGKYLMTRICRDLGVHPHVFYQGAGPSREDEQEQNVLNLMREARELGIIGKIQEYAEYLIEKSEREEKIHTKKKAG